MKEVEGMEGVVEEDRKGDTIEEIDDSKV